MADPTIQAQLGVHVGRMLSNCRRSVEDLTVEQLNHLPGERTNSIGFDVWHVVRTADNVIHFVFEREQPVWLSGGFQERMGLPKVAQGTGMTDEEAHALRFPEPAAMVEYIDAVKAAIIPRIEAMSDEYLATPVALRPWGELPRMEQILQVLVAHGNGHLGRCSMARALLGKDDLGF